MTCPAALELAVAPAPPVAAALLLLLELELELQAAMSKPEWRKTEQQIGMFFLAVLSGQMPL